MKYEDLKLKSPPHMLFLPEPAPVFLNNNTEWKRFPVLPDGPCPDTYLIITLRALQNPVKPGIVQMRRENSSDFVQITCRRNVIEAWIYYPRVTVLDNFNWGCVTESLFWTPFYDSFREFVRARGMIPGDDLYWSLLTERHPEAVRVVREQLRTYKSLLSSLNLL